MTAISPDDNRDDNAHGRLSAYPLASVRSEEDIAELAATGGALVTAIIAQRWNETNRSWLQRRIGAMPSRQAREEITVRIGALLGGTLTYLLAIGATEGLHRLHDRKQQREMARSVCRILGVAATAPDGSMPDEASFIVESALMSMGVGAKTRKRLLAEPRPASISDLGACPLPEPLLSAVAVIAFTAMAEATSPDDAVRQMPALLRRMGLARPAAETKAREILDEYNSTYLVLSDLAAQLRPETPERPRRVRPPGRPDDRSRLGRQRPQPERGKAPSHPPGNCHTPPARYPCHYQRGHADASGGTRRGPDGWPVSRRRSAGTAGAQRGYSAHVAGRGSVPVSRVQAVKDNLLRSRPAYDIPGRHSRCVRPGMRRYWPRRST